MKPVLEHIDQPQQHSFYLGHYVGEGFTYPWHYHPQWELTYIVKGAGTAYAGNAVRHFIEGELCLLPPHLPHCWKSSGNQTSEAESLYVQWDADSLLGEGWLNKAEFRAIRTLLESAHSGLVMASERAVELGQELAGLQEMSPIESLLKFIRLLNDLALCPTKPVSHEALYYKDSAASKRIEAILNYISQNYQDKIQAEELAQLTNMTPVSFSKYFTRTFHKTFTQYLNEYRVSQACGLLINTEEPVEEVAYQCGYPNMAFFHRQFKKIVGNTPLQYRKQFRALG